MDKKAMLKKLFTRYAVLGAQSASARGCYETPIPDALTKKVASGERIMNRTKRK